MKITNFFKNVFSYAAGMEKWCKDFYGETSGNKLQFTFCADFPIADWYGENELKESYKRIKEDWINDYKAF